MLVILALAAHVEFQPRVAIQSFAEGIERIRRGKINRHRRAAPTEQRVGINQKGRVEVVATLERADNVDLALVQQDLVTDVGIAEKRGCVNACDRLQPASFQHAAAHDAQVRPHVHAVRGDGSNGHKLGPPALLPEQPSRRDDNAIDVSTSGGSRNLIDELDLLR